MLTASLKQGWCPTLDTPMATGDGLLVRVKPPGATLTPDQAHALADAAIGHGNGIIELTNRGNLQFRGLRPETTTPFATCVRNLGLALPPAQEARRPVLPPPLLGADPTLAPNAAALTAHIEAAFQTDPRLANLPAKFTVAIKAGGILSPFTVHADLHAYADANAHATIARAPQTTPSPRTAWRSYPGSPAEAVIQTLLDHEAILELGGKSPALPGGSPGGAIAESHGFKTPAGELPYPNTSNAAFGLAPPFGQLDATMLHRLADLAAHHATTLRITPWRTILLASVPEGTLIDAPQFISDPADPRLLVTACIGAPGCARATVPTRQLAALLRPTTRIHLSACPKGCAHPAPSPLTFVGNNGLYDLVRNGRASDAPAHTGLTPADLVQAIT